MSKIASNWAHGIGQNIASTLLLALLGGVAVMLGSLTPSIEQYAPLSYLLTFLIAVLLALVVANLSIMFWRRWVSPVSANPPSPTPDAAVRPHDNSKLHLEIATLSKTVGAVVKRLEHLESKYRGEITISRETLQAVTLIATYLIATRDLVFSNDLMTKIDLEWGNVSNAAFDDRHVGNQKQAISTWRSIALKYEQLLDSAAPLSVYGITMDNSKRYKNNNLLPVQDEDKITFDAIKVDYSRLLDRKIVLQKEIKDLSIYLFRAIGSLQNLSRIPSLNIPKIEIPKGIGEPRN